MDAWRDTDSYQAFFRPCGHQKRAICPDIPPFLSQFGLWFSSIDSFIDTKDQPKAAKEWILHGGIGISNTGRRQQRRILSEAHVIDAWCQSWSWLVSEKEIRFLIKNEQNALSMCRIIHRWCPWTIFFWWIIRRMSSEQTLPRTYWIPWCRLPSKINPDSVMQYCIYCTTARSTHKRSRIWLGLQ